MYYNGLTFRPGQFRKWSSYNIKC